MTHRLLNRAALAILATGLVLTSGCIRTPTEKPVYKEARRAIEALESLPEKAKVLSIAKSKLYIGKSAARADLQVAHKNASGQKVESWYTVHLKRVARTWVAQDAALRPDAAHYAKSAPATDGEDPLTP